MGQSSLNFNADLDEEDEEPGADSFPKIAQGRDSDSPQSPNFQLAAASNPVGDAARSANATRTNAAPGDDSSSDAPSDPSVPSDASRDSESPQPFQSQPAQTPAPAQAAFTRQQAGDATSDGGDSDAQPAASGAAPAPRQRQPVKQIGQIPIMDDAWMYEPFPGPDAQTAEQIQKQHEAWMRMAQQSQAQHQQIAQINQSDPYISDDDGRWKKQTADPATGAIHETDILDAESGKVDRGTGDIYVQTAQGPHVIDVDPQQKRLAQIVAQKTQAHAQGSPVAANIASARSALSDTQQQLDAYQGLPERMNAQIAKYTQASLDPNNAAAYQLQNAQTAFNHWKQQNPRYTALSAKRDALASQIQTQTAAKAQN
jgi:hypothetical protein